MNEDVHKVLNAALQTEAKKLENVFSSVMLFVDISCSLDPSLNVKFSWCGNTNLMGFIENLPKLKSKAPELHDFMLDEYGDIIDKGKKLTAKLKLQGLPISSITVIFDDFYRSGMKYKVYTPDEKATWVRESYSSGADLEFRLNRHLDDEKLILVDICEVLTRTFYVYLTTVLEDVKSLAKEET